MTAFLLIGAVLAGIVIGAVALVLFMHFAFITGNSFLPW